MTNLESIKKQLVMEGKLPPVNLKIVDELLSNISSLEEASEKLEVFFTSFGNMIESSAFEIAAEIRDIDALLNQVKMPQDELGVLMFNTLTLEQVQGENNIENILDVMESILKERASH